MSFWNVKLGLRLHMQRHHFMGVYKHIISIWASELQIFFFEPFLQSSRLSLHLNWLQRRLTLSLSTYVQTSLVFASSSSSSPPFEVVLYCFHLPDLFVCWRRRDLCPTKNFSSSPTLIFRCRGSSRHLGNHLHRRWCRRFSNCSNSSKGGSWKRCLHSPSVLFAQQKN